MEKLKLRLLLPSLAVIVIATMVPAGLRHPSLHSISYSFDPSDFANNILLYVPLGIALGGASLLRATFCGFAMATLAECLQMWYVDRIPSPLDILSNTLGAAAGYLLAKVIMRFHHDPTSLPIPRWIAPVGIVVGILGAVGLVYHQPASDFSNWDANANLSVGSRNNDVSALQIYPYTLTDVQVQSLHCAEDASLPGGGLLPTNDQRSIYDALTRQNQLTLVACVNIHDIEPYRVSRSVTYAKDRERNFTLAGIGDALIFILRTPSSAPYGRAAAALSGPVLVPNRPVLAVAVYDGRLSRLFVDGHLAAHIDLRERRPHLPGHVLRLLPQPVPVREIEWGAAEALLAGLLATGILGTFGVPHARWQRITTGVVSGMVVGAIVWAFGVSAPHLGLRILLESIVAGITIAVSATAGSGTPAAAST